MLAAAEPAPVHSLENYYFLAHALFDGMIKTASYSTEYKNHLKKIHVRLPE